MAHIPLYPVSVAPMMDYSDRHFRYFMRQMTKKALLYTEMINTQAIIHGDRHKLLDFSPLEKPVALQLGGDNPQQLAESARIGQDWGYDEINLNVGCPSSRVQNGNFGACLMAQPDKVARCVETMTKAVDIPVTVKHRIGIDNQDSYESMANFVKIVAEGGCQRFVVHARKAWLQGLSPKENRHIPPLRYEDVYRLKQEFPHLIIEINGGITTIEAIKTHLNYVDGVMIGRVACDNPYLLATIDQQIYGDRTSVKTREEIILNFLPYVDQWCSQNVKLNTMMRHLLQIFAGQPGTKIWKRYLTQNGYNPDADSKTVLKALELKQDQAVKLEEIKNKHLSFKP